MSTSHHIGDPGNHSHHPRLPGNPPPIRYVPRHEIDTARWDACIQDSLNSLIYASSTLLDTMAAHWDALIMEEYKAVMPLCWNKKWGIRYLYHPALTPQLGIFSPQPVTQELISAFIAEAKRHFPFAEIFLNYGNTYPGLRPFTNIVLDLSPAYDLLRKDYRSDLLKNLKQAARHPLEYSGNQNVDNAVTLFQKYCADRTPHVGPADYKRFSTFCSQAIRQNGAVIRTVGLPGDPSLAVALLLRDVKRLYLLMSICTPAGRKMSANHFLLDNLIREFAGTKLILDFDGSEIPGIAHFYRNFGGSNQPFYFLRWNRLPWPARLLKPDKNAGSWTFDR